MPELSIIVPVYNVEKYLPKCIESILAQTFTDFELILIDDGSPDRCGEICDGYAAKDSRIVVIHQKNQGVSAARNAGLDIAKGRYIGFVDSDDWIEPEMYEQMLEQKRAKQMDVIFCRYQKCFEDGSTAEGLKAKELTFRSTDELLQSLYKKPLPTGGVCWNTILEKNVIGDCRFEASLSMKEDIVFLFDVFKKCVNGYLMPNALYHFRQQRESATRSCVSSALVKTLPANKVLLQRAAAYSKEMERKAADKMLDDGIRFIQMIKKDSSVERREKRKMLFQVKKYFWKCFISSLLYHRLNRAQVHGYLNSYFR